MFLTGLLISLEAEIELKEGASPKFCKPRLIPFGLIIATTQDAENIFKTL